jgi:adenylosuccinate lyase
LLTDWWEIRRARDGVRGKGIKGAVGTSASYAELLEGAGWTPADLEARVMKALELDAYLVTTQVSPRKQEWLAINALAGLAASLHKMMFDLRLLQSPLAGEWSEPFRDKQVGSSAMPFKRNPIKAENVDSLARWVAALPRVAWDNAALSLLERTLDDSANRRLLLPDAFLAADEMLRVSKDVIRELQINGEAVTRNLQVYGTFAAVERLLMALGKAGANRQVMHERLREHSMAAWRQVAQGEPNPLGKLLNADEEITRYIPAERIRALLDARRHIGDAPDRARLLAAEIRQALAAIAER